jgi:3-oxoacyl-[acyl-carrier-protein] synthase II
MAERPPAPANRGHSPAAAVTGVAVLTAYGRGTQALLTGVLAGRAAFGPVSRFDVSARRTRVAATIAGSPVLIDELIDVVDQACQEAGLTPRDRSGCPLLLAVHGDPRAARVAAPDRAAHRTGAMASTLTQKCGLSATTRVYTTACVSASTAVADAAAMIARGDADRVVVAAGYLVEPDQFALFDAGRALASDGAVRPFSAGRTGLLLGDGVAALVLESAAACARRGAPPLAWVAGWGRTGDAYHVVQPHPDGAGLARAIGAALGRAGITPADLGYVNAHGSGSAHSDAAEANALARALGEVAPRVPVSSTKSLHGQSLEASPLVEVIATVLALRQGELPVNAGYLGRDEACPLNVIIDRPLATKPRWALSLNAAFGGANTALVLESAP